MKTREEREDFSYYEAYLPLWQKWAKQNPELIEELREKAKGKVLTDMFANTRVSQARALADILNSTADDSESENTSNTEENNNTDTEYKFYSGGARGSDTAWANASSKIGIETVEYSVISFSEPSS